jgi:hypothetical protein
MDSRYRVKTNKTRNTGNSRLKIEWRQTKQGTLAIIDSRYREKTNKTRNTGNNRHKTLYLESNIASVPCFVCLHCILSLLLPVCLVLFVFTLYLEPTIASVPCFVCLHSVSWAYYCQCSLFCLSSLCILTRDTGNKRLKIQSEDKQNKGHWQ